MNKSISKYMSEQGKKGGAKSRRVLTAEQARAMVEAKKAKNPFCVNQQVWITTIQSSAKINKYCGNGEYKVRLDNGDIHIIHIENIVPRFHC